MHLSALKIATQIYVRASKLLTLVNQFWDGWGPGHNVNLAPYLNCPQPQDVYIQTVGWGPPCNFPMSAAIVKRRMRLFFLYVSGSLSGILILSK